MAPRDYYEVLGIRETASLKEIKSSFRKAALKWHPDRNPQNKVEAEVHFRECLEAFTVLSDPRKRKIFDTFGIAGLDDSGAREDFRTEILTALRPVEELLR